MVDIKRPLKKIDSIQQSHDMLSFPIAVIKKYDDDQGGFQAALLTYYGFLSLFPLLLVFTTVVQLAFSGNSHFKQRIINGATTYFPIVGRQLQSSVQGTTKSGLALFLALLFTFYGARGAANAFRNTANNLWRIPRQKRSGFLPALLQSFYISIVGGIGLVGAAVIASYANGYKHDVILRLTLLIINVLVLYGSFILMMRIALAHKVPFSKLRIGAATFTIGLLILQYVGGYIITHELKNFDNLYGTFAVVLGLLFWIYLQMQLLVYTMEIDTVRDMKLWPRSIL